MTCCNCGNEISDSDNMCHSCGYVINSSRDFKNIETEKASYFSNLISTLRTSRGYSADYYIDNGKYKKIKKETKRLKLLIPVTFACVFLIVFLAFLGYKDKLFYSKEGKRTIMIYMIGSDLESKYYAASRDIDEILNSSIDYDDVNILLYTGGTKNWHTDEIPKDKNALFSISSGSLNKIEEFDSSNMLDYRNLSYLLKYGYDNYDTQYYDLILWDHGAGPMYGYGYDEYHSSGTMSLLDIKKALDDSPFNGFNKLEFIGFDACLMSTVEVAYVLSNYSDYMVASQEFEPANGWDYSFLSDIDSSTTTLEVGSKIVNSYYDYYSDKSYVNGFSLSFLKLNKMELVERYLDELFSLVDEGLMIDFSSISKTRSNSKSFGRISDNNYFYDLVDLNDLIKKLPEKYNEQVSKLQSILADLVVYEVTDLENTNGISVYFPYDNKNKVADNISLYNEFAFAPNYYDFISNFVNKLTEIKEPSWDLSQYPIESISDGVAFITLDDYIINNYSKISYVVFEKFSDNYFMPIFNGNDVDVNGNVVSTSLTNKALVAKDKDGNEMYLTAMQTVKGKNYVKYYIPGTLSKWDTSSYDFEIVPVYLEFVVSEEHPDGYVASVLPMGMNENYTYSEIEYNLDEWDSLTVNNYRYSILDESGNYMSDWQGSSIVNSLEFSTEEDIDISFTNLDISHNYYCLFRIYDEQGTPYSSSIVEINQK